MINNSELPFMGSLLSPHLNHFPHQAVIILGYNRNIPNFQRTSLVAQLVKNPPAMWETWVQSLGWEDPLEKAKATPSSSLAWRIPWTVSSMDSQSDTTE